MKASILPFVLFLVSSITVVSSVSGQTTDVSILEEDSLLRSVTVLPESRNDDIPLVRNVEQISPETQTERTDTIIVRQNEQSEGNENDDLIVTDQETSGSENVQIIAQNDSSLEPRVSSSSLPSALSSNETANTNLKADLSPDNQSNVSVNNSTTDTADDARIAKQTNPVTNAPADKAQLHHLIRHVPPHLFHLIRPAFFSRQDDNSPESQKFNVLCHSDNQRRTIDSGRFQQFFMNPKNHDVMFSICGQLFPAHKIVIESSSPFLAKIIEQFQQNSPQLPVNVHIDSFDSFTALINGDTLVPSNKDKCAQPEFVEAFKVLLKYFYAGEVALDDITNLKSALLLINMVKPIVTQPNIEYAITERIGSLMTLDDIAAIHRFARQQGSLNLKKKVNIFIHQNRAQIIARNVTHLPITCEDADLEYVDDYISSLDVSQTQAIAYISYFMNNCPNFGPKVKELQNSKINPFKNSISLFRSNVADLKHLVKLGFITYEILSAELENRLRLAENELESVRMKAPIPIVHHRRVPEMIPSASHNVQQFFQLNPIIRSKHN